MALETSKIEARATDILVEHLGNISELDLPINISKITDDEDLTIVIGDFRDQRVSGAFNRNEKKIYVSKSDAYTRKAFTVAHELGHYFLHQDENEEVFLRLYNDEPDTPVDVREVEANKFAAALLMPSELVERYWLVTGNIVDIARIFGVSNTTANFRLQSLGLL